MPDANSQHWWCFRELQGSGVFGPRTTARRRLEKLRKAHPEISTRPTARQGGESVEYDIETFPQSIKTQLLAKLQGPLSPEDEHRQLRHQSLWRRFECASEKQKKKAERKTRCLLKEVELATAGFCRIAALKQAAKEFGQRNWKTLYAWKDAVKDLPQQDWLPALLDLRGGSEPKKEYPRYFKLASDYYLQPLKPTLADAHRFAVKVCGQEQVPHPSGPDWLKREIRRQFKKTEITLLRDGEDALAKQYPPMEMNYDDIQSSQGLSVDFQRASYPGDEPIRIRWEDGTEQQAIYIMVGDIRSRRILHCDLVHSENADEFRTEMAATYDKTQIWPEFIHGDNTRAIAAKQISGKAPGRHRWRNLEEDIEGVFTLLRCKVRFSLPRNAQGKVIERCNRDFRQSLFRDPRLAAWKGKVIPVAEFRKILFDFATEYNARRGLRGKGTRGRSRDDIYSANLPAVPKVLTKEQRRLLDLGATKVRTNTDNGEIQFLGNRYWAPILTEFKGQFVTIRFNPKKLSEGIVAYEMGEHGRLIGEIPWLLSASYGDTKAARDHNRDKRAFIKLTKQVAVKKDRMNAHELAKLIPRQPDPAPTTQPNVVAVQFEKPIDVPIRQDRSAEQQKIRAQMGAAIDQLWEENQRRQKIRRIL